MSDELIDYMVSYCYPTTNLVNILIANNDPRLEEWIDPSGNDQSIGIQPGLHLDQIGEPTNHSRRAEDYFLYQKKNRIFMT
jgi:hypothetical protein